MKKIEFLLLIFWISFSCFAQGSFQNKAEEAYQKGDYQKALNFYEDLSKKEGNSALLNYNVGNCYYKLKQYPQAILYYERSLLQSPHFEDAKVNLQLAKLQIVDKIDPIDTFFLNDWIKSIRNMFNSNTWSIIGIVSFILIIISLFMYAFSSKMILRKLGFFGGLIMLLICISSNLFASKQKSLLIDRNQAIVFTPTVSVKSSPAESGTDLFVVHEGTKVKVKSTLSNWSEIQLEDGNIGWLPTSSLEVI